MFFIVSLAIIDPTTQWFKRKEDDDEDRMTTSAIKLIGRPRNSYFSQDQQLIFDFETTIEYGESTWTANDGNIDYGCWARMVFWSLQSATEQYDKKILEILDARKGGKP